MGEPVLTLQPETQQSSRENVMVDSSTNRQEVRANTERRRLTKWSSNCTDDTTTIKRSHTSSTLQDQQAEDPFRTLRSFHEKQRGERQQNDTHQTSITLHSMFEGAVGGVRTDQPKPQRITKRHQQQGQPQDRIQNQEINHLRQENYMQGPQNTTTYMNLPNPVQIRYVGDVG